MKKLLLIVSLFLMFSCNEKTGYGYSDLYSFTAPLEQTTEVNNTASEPVTLTFDVFRDIHAKVKNLPLQTSVYIMSTGTTAENMVDYQLLSNELDFSNDPNKQVAKVQLKIFPDKITDAKTIVLRLSYTHENQVGPRESDTKIIHLKPTTVQ